MKKKDLVPGTIYSPKRSTPYLLLSTGIWRVPRSYGVVPTRYFLLAEGSKPERGSSYTDSGQGVLALSGSYEVMRGLQKDHADSIAAIAALVPGEQAEEHTEPVQVLLDLAKRQYPDEHVYLRLENYRSWVGTYDEVRVAEDERTRQLRLAVDELEERSKAARERGDGLEERIWALLEDRMRLGRVVGRVKSSNGATGSYVTSGLELSYEKLERLLELAEKGKQVEAGLTDPAGDFITE